MKLFSEVSTLSSLVTISFVKAEIQIFDIATSLRLGQVIKRSRAFKDGSLSKLSHHPANFGVGRNCVSGDIMDLACQCDFLGETLIESHHSEDIMILVCHVILQDHVFKRLFDFIAWESFILSHYPAQFGGHGHCGSGDIMVLVCYVILPDHMTTESGNFIGRSHSR